MKTPRHIAHENARQWGSDLTRDRFRHGLTLDEAGDRAGLSGHTVSLIERGLGTVPSVARCLDAYGTPRPHLAESVRDAAWDVYALDRESEGFAAVLACMSERRLRRLAAGAPATMIDVGALVLVLGWRDVIGRVSA
jgi:DNA-binding XRE family transcriptional regulator